MKNFMMRIHGRAKRYTTPQKMPSVPTVAKTMRSSSRPLSMLRHLRHAEGVVGLAEQAVVQEVLVDVVGHLDHLALVVEERQLGVQVPLGRDRLGGEELGLHHGGVLPTGQLRGGALHVLAQLGRRTGNEGERREKLRHDQPFFQRGRSIIPQSNSDVYNEETWGSRTPVHQSSQRKKENFAAEVMRS